MNKTPLEILKFTPILKDKIWGGRKLHSLLNKSSDSPTVGESWEISDVQGDCSVVCTGSLKGQTLQELLLHYKEDLIGIKNYKRFGDRFPLLIKFIDANEALSVQLHPDDEIAKQKHNSFGKTEMWYIMQSDPDANIIVGFNQPMTTEKYQQHVADNTIREVLNEREVKEGDTFFIHAGLIHAIGKGVLLAEIQQTSDITYRIYDWDRTDADGNSRELHQQEALEAIEFNTDKEPKVAYTSKMNVATDLVKCLYFKTKLIEADTKMTISFDDLDSFVVLMCVAGNAVIKCDVNEMKINRGETILIPASIKAIEIHSENVKLLQTYV